MRINHNISALNTNNILGKNDSALGKSLERLSSGLRINRAADDAAGMAISQKMKTQIAGLNQASRNASDGISIIQTAEGALIEVEEMLQRMRELAVQAANGTSTDDDKAQLQAEVDQLKDEINRISETTEFNTKKLLDGTLDRRSYCSNPNVELISLSDSVNVKDYKFSMVGEPAVLQGGAITAETIPAGLADYNFNVNGTSVTIPSGSNLEETLASINTACEKEGIRCYFAKEVTNENGTVSYQEIKPEEATVGNILMFETEETGASETISITADKNLANILGLKETNFEHGEDPKSATQAVLITKEITGTKVPGTKESYNITVNNQNITIPAGANLQDVLTNLNEVCGKMGVQVNYTDGTIDSNGKYNSISVDDATTGSKLLFTTNDYGSDAEIKVYADEELANMLGLSTAGSSAKGTDASITLDTTATGGFSNTATVSIDGDYVTVRDRDDFEMVFKVSGTPAEPVTVTVLDVGPMTLQIGANEGQTVEVRVPRVDTTTLNIDTANIGTQEGADAAITLFDTAINEVSKIRSKLGAYQNRLDHAINSLDVSAENLTEALSRIEDTDMAGEMADYTQNQVLTQAATSMLAQANERPQSILSLLQS